MEKSREDTMNKLLKKINACIECDESADTAEWVSILKNFFLALDIEASTKEKE